MFWHELFFFEVQGLKIDLMLNTLYYIYLEALMYIQYISRMEESQWRVVAWS